MKRSEMLDKLEKAMHEAEGAHPWSLAEIALNVVEEAGMLPPPYTYWNAPKPYKYNENGIPEGLKTHHFNGETINQWETE